MSAPRLTVRGRDDLLAVEAEFACPPARPRAVRGSVAALSLLKLLATLSLLFSREPAAEAAEPPRPRVGVPFGCGLAFEVSQAHNTGSHLNNDVYAWDFRMPEGVPIVAARGGVVRMARGDSTVGGGGPP